MARETKNEDRKQRIRDAFQESQAVERMPAREDMQPQNSEDVELRVAPYCRVSTMSEMQAESFEIQQQLLKAPYQNEYYVTRNQIAAYESHEIDDICDYLTVHELLELPYTARSEYVLYRWNDVFGNTEKIRSMVDRLRYQVECFNEALPYEAGQSYGDRAASQVRVIYRIS